MEHKKYVFRHATPQDLESVLALFLLTIRESCAPIYDAAQRDAWIASANNTQRWLDKLSSQFFMVAEWEGQLVGFASLEAIQTIDLLYVHPDFQRQGIAQELYNHLENEALRHNAKFLKAEVSKTALPFFMAQGFVTLASQEILCEGVSLENFRMEKHLWE